MINKLLTLFGFKKSEPVYGKRIFQHRTWLSRQVDDAMYKQFKNQIFKVK